AIDCGRPHPRTRPDECVVADLSAIPLEGNPDIGWPVYPHTYIYLLAAWGGVGVEIAQVLGLVDEASYRELLATDRASIYLILRLLSAAAGTLAVWLAIRLSTTVFSRAVALGVGWLVATNFLHNRESHTIKPDVLLSVAILIALMLAVPLARKATNRRGILAGLAIAGAIGMKYPGVMVAPAIYVAALLGSGSLSMRGLLPLPGVLAALATAGFFLTTNPYVFTSDASVAKWQGLARANLPMLFDEAPAGEVERIGPSEEQLERLARLGNLPDYNQKPWWSGFAFHTRFSLAQGCGWLATLLAPFALAWALLAGQRPRRALTVPAAIFVVCYFALFSISPAQMSRYMTPMIPVLLMLEVAMLAEGIAVVARRNDRVRRLAVPIVLGLAVLLGGASAAKTFGHNRIAGAEDTRNLATQWLAENTPKGARIKILGTLFMPYGRPIVPKGRWGSPAESTIEALVEDRVSYVVTHDHDLFSSTIDPEEFSAIESRLKLLAEFDPYQGGAGHPEDIVYETADAYYIPIAGFANQVRPGPRVRIYRFRRSL
ncbi:MAG: phospholipid carrier-dependent glycosyltransferase, partial [bacterium]|nr:phospholipid carrier-dependent glycosyltransferase [bacterium]